MASPFFIRTASKKDLEAVKALLLETWHATYDAIFGAEVVNEITALWHSIDALEKRLKVPMSEFVLADDGQAILGMAFASQQEKTVTLHQMYVLPSAQGRGVGTELMQEIFFCFDSADTIVLDVHPDNTNAIGFYASGGFKQTRRMEVEGPGEMKIPHIVMARPLDE